MDKLVSRVSENFPLDNKSIKEINSEEKLLDVLSTFIQVLIDKDFSKLVNTLYRIDVSEIKLKKILEKNSPKIANVVIAELIIQREKEKIKTRETYKTKSS